VSVAVPPAASPLSPSSLSQGDATLAALAGVALLAVAAFKKLGGAQAVGGPIRSTRDIMWAV
jgi:hypothetical protein